MAMSSIVASDGRDGLFHATDGHYAAIVLDRMLPGMDGLAVLSALRAAGIETPVIVLSALGSTDERVKGLKSGLGRLSRQAVRFFRAAGPDRSSAAARTVGCRSRSSRRFNCADLQHGPSHAAGGARREARSTFSRASSGCSSCCCAIKGQVVTRTMMLEEVWDYHFDPGTNVIDVHISRLRKKIDEACGHSAAAHRPRCRLHAER